MAVKRAFPGKYYYTASTDTLCYYYYYYYYCCCYYYLLSFRDIGSVFIPTCFIKFALYRPCSPKQYEKNINSIVIIRYYIGYILHMYYVYVNVHKHT